MSYKWDPSNAILKCLQKYQTIPNQKWLPTKLSKRWIKLKHRFWSVVTGTDIHLEARIGKGLKLPHPNGVVIHPEAIIGDNCMIMQQVTIGQLATAGAPRIGNNVYIGAGAKLLGPIKIGDRVAIGANAVVLCDVPDDHTAVGIPASCRPTKPKATNAQR